MKSPMKSLMLIAALLVTSLVVCDVAQANGGRGRVVQRQVVVQRVQRVRQPIFQRQVQRVVVQPQVQQLYVQPVQQFVQPVYTQPLILQQQLQMGYGVQQFVQPQCQQMILGY